MIAFLSAFSKDDKFTKVFNSFQTNRGLADNTRQCWEKMASIRSSSLCSICSARHQLFTKETKGLVAQSDCDSILQVCALSFEHIFEFSRNIENLMSDIAKSQSGHGAKNTEDIVLRKILAKFTTFNREIQQNHILQSINRFMARDPSDAENCPAKIADLCSRLVRVFEEPFIKSMHDLLAGKNQEFSFSIYSKLLASNLSDKEKG